MYRPSSYIFRYQAASFILRNWNYFVKKGLFFTLKPFFRNLYMTQTAGELLFDGYPEPLIKLSRAVPLFNNFNFPNWDRFGWLYNGIRHFQLHHFSSEPF
ncbi:hypothetical protein Zmor_025853 [Zophobas morio]|uniref:Uncharacterized protein n=1 Tax=Zophobas morio TaxID=2755281 RepID=A0AA38HUW5_9CUCU|nr:hypothetical protein Zmor_025853 [Zophobas morio]